MSKKILSLTGRVWEIAAADNCCGSSSIASDSSSLENSNHDMTDSDGIKSELANYISDIDELCKILLKNRDISDIKSFKKIALKNSLPEPLTFVDMKAAIDRIVAAIESGQAIAIFGDYDVDGICSTVLLMRFFNYIGVKFSYTIPNRMDDGYGFSVDSLEQHKKDLVVTVDCGSSAFDELSYAKTNNIDVVVVDHHKMEKIPSCIALVNPHRPDESDKYHYLCAAGVVFILLVGLNRALRESGFYSRKKLSEPNLFDYLDLVALATVCDVMPLVELNRAFVIAGIKAMHRRKNLGIDALMNLTGQSKVSSDTIGFVFGPRINAAGRIDSADIGVKLLSTQNPIEAKKIAQKLDDLNKQRQSIEAEITAEAETMIDETQKFICVYKEDWHIGVVGIVAGRLKEKYQKPTFVISIGADSNARGSCRSIDGVDITALVKGAIEQGIVISGGGHAMAAGFCISREKIPSFIDYLEQNVKYDDVQEVLRADCYLPADMIALETADALEQLGPFGNGNVHPKFVIPNLEIVNRRIVGKNHIQLSFRDKKSGESFNAISFKSKDTSLGDILLSCRGLVQILGAISVSEWNGRKCVSFIMDDIASCDKICSL